MEIRDRKIELTKKAILYLLPITIIIATIFVLVFGWLDLLLLESYIAIPVFLALIVFYKCQYNPHKAIIIKEKLFSLLIISYLFGLIVSIIILYKFEIRTFLYYIVLTFMSLSILFEILFFNINKKKVDVILIQIMILSLNIIFGVTLKYYFYIGGGDTLVHIDLIRNLIEYGHVTNYFDIYEQFPLWHILNSILYQLSPLIPLNKIMFLINGLIYACILPMIYCISSEIFKNKRIGLLSALFVCFFQGFIYYGMYSISRSITSFFLITLVLLFLNRSKRKHILVIFITLTIIMYHTVTILYVILIFVIIFILMEIYDVDVKDKLYTKNYLFLIFTITLAYWIYYADKLFRALVQEINAPQLAAVSMQFVMYSAYDKAFNYLHLSLLLFFVVIGVLYALQSKKYTILAKVFVITGISLISVTYPGPLYMLTKLASLNITRFEQYTFLFICTAGAVGFSEIFYKTKKYAKILIVVLFVLMFFLSISNDYTSSDNPLVKKPGSTNYLSEEEIIAFNHISRINYRYMLSDYITYRYFKNSPHEDKSFVLGVNKNSTEFITGNNDNTMIIIRSGELKKRPLFLYTSLKEYEDVTELGIGVFSKNLNYYGGSMPLYNDLNNMNKIYSSGNVLSFNQI